MCVAIRHPIFLCDIVVNKKWKVLNVRDCRSGNSSPDMSKLMEEVNRLAKDLDRQNEMLAEITKKVRCSCDLVCALSRLDITAGDVVVWLIKIIWTLVNKDYVYL